MKPKYIQVDCTEGNRVDLRQSKAILRYKPDLIFLEYSKVSSKPILKPVHISKSIISKYPWTESDNFMWANIVKLWNRNHRVLVYAVDGPHDLVSGANIYSCDKTRPYKTTSLFWWVRIYLRECFMVKNIKLILKQYKNKENPVILVFLQSFHWQHVKFLLSDPSKKAIWIFYFRRFGELTSKDVSRLVNEENKILFKYWNSPVNSCK